MTRIVMTSLGSADVAPTCEAGPVQSRPPSASQFYHFLLSLSFFPSPCLSSLTPSSFERPVLMLHSILFRPSEGHFSPFLLHIKAEVEDGSPVSGKSPDEFPVRFGFDESVFPGFSWRGYAVVSDLQVSNYLIGLGPVPWSRLA